MNNNLCINCKTEQKFKGHNFCRKSCAKTYAQITPKCILCENRPKYINSDFCGLTCVRASKCACGKIRAYNGSSWSNICIDCIEKN